MDSTAPRLFWVVAALLVAAITAAFLVDEHRSPSHGPRVPELGELLWAPQFMAGTQHYADAQLADMARHTTAIAVLHDAITAPQATALRRANPSTRLLVYVNASFAQRGQASTYPPSWYAHDASGQPITSQQYGTFLMDPYATGWDDTVANRCRAFAAETTADGCFLDTLGTGPIEDPSYLSGVPIDSTTGRPLRVDAWSAGAVRRVQHVRERNDRLALVGNFLRDGIRFARNRPAQEPLLQALDGAMAETWLRDPGQPLSRFPTITDWRADVDLVSDVQRDHREAFLVTKTWAVGDDAVRRQWHDFAAASFLLATDGTSRFSFLAASNPDAIVAADPWAGLAIGRPSGAMEGDGTLFRRRFTNGTVLVNPTNSSADATLSPAGYTIDGTRHRSITLAPHTGVVVTDTKPSTSTSS